VVIVIVFVVLSYEQVGMLGAVALPVVLNLAEALSPEEFRITYPTTVLALYITACGIDITPFKVAV
jgi:hypothetical protein